jgi:hypothetical protein
MAEKPKARKAPAKTDAASKQKEQSARFIKAAREIGVDESGKEFEKALGRALRPKPSKNHS